MPSVDAEEVVDLEPDRTKALRAETLKDAASPAHHARASGMIVRATVGHDFQPGWLPADVRAARVRVRRGAPIDDDTARAATPADPTRCQWCGRPEPAHDARTERGDGRVARRRA